MVNDRLLNPMGNRPLKHYKKKDYLNLLTGTGYIIAYSLEGKEEDYHLIRKSI